MPATGTGTGTGTAQVTTTSTVAAEVFAAGHLGELTQQVPFELVDAVLEQTRATQQRLRELPSRVGVYFVLALGLFPALGYGKVWGKLVAGLRGLGVACPSDKALRDLRRRLGPAPVKALFEVLAGPVAGPPSGGAVRALPHGRLRRLHLDQGRRQRARRACQIFCGSSGQLYPFRYIDWLRC